MSAVRKQNQKIEADVLSQNLSLPVQIDEIARIRGWFRPPDNSIYYPLIQAYLDDKTDLQDTLHKVTAPLDESRRRDKMYDAWGDLWYSIIHSVKRISYRDEQKLAKLVSFMEALSKEPDYKEFPHLSMYSREAWNDAPGYGAGWTAPEASAWMSYNYFLARLDVEELFEGLTSYGFWSLRGALEQNFADDDEEDIMNAGTRTQKYDSNVPAAAAWVLVAGKKLFEQKEDDDPKLRKKDIKLEDLRDGNKLWPGAAKFSKERWAFWKERFGEISGMNEVGEETRSIAKEAAETMENAESN